MARGGGPGPWPACALLAAACCGTSAAQCSYEVTNFFYYPINCGSGSVITVGVDWNDRGDVVGFYSCPFWTHFEAFLRTAEGQYMTLIRPPGVVSSMARGINNDRVIVGTYVVSGIGQRGFVYENGRYTELPSVNPASGWSNALAISNQGDVVGWRAIVDDSAPYNAFIWSASNGFLDLGVLSGPYSSATAINEAGVVAGWAGNGAWMFDGFRWENGNVTMLGSIPGGSGSRALAISENGVIVGSGRIPMKGAPFGAPRAFRWEDGQYTMLGTLPGHAWSRAHGVSPDGYQVVGRSWNVNGNPSIDHAFLWQQNVIYDLNDLVDAGFGLSGALLVNQSGQILTNGGILTPIDPPLGDLDHDCRVGVIDFLILLDEWGPGDSPADLDGSGTVGPEDIAILFDNWG